MSVTIDLSDNEQAILENYAKQHSLTVEQAIKTTLLEIIEYKVDLLAAEEAHKEFVKNPVTYSHDDAWAEIMGE